MWLSLISTPFHMPSIHAGVCTSSEPSAVCGQDLHCGLLFVIPPTGLMRCSIRGNLPALTPHPEGKSCPPLTLWGSSTTSVSALGTHPPRADRGGGNAPDDSVALPVGVFSLEVRQGPPPSLSLRICTPPHLLPLSLYLTVGLFGPRGQGTGTILGHFSLNVFLVPASRRQTAKVSEYGTLRLRDHRIPIVIPPRFSFSHPGPAYPLCRSPFHTIPLGTAHP